MNKKPELNSVFYNIALELSTAESAKFELPTPPATNHDIIGEIDLELRNSLFLGAQRVKNSLLLRGESILMPPGPEKMSVEKGVHVLEGEAVAFFLHFLIGCTKKFTISPDNLHKTELIKKM